MNQNTPSLNSECPPLSSLSAREYQIGLKLIDGSSNAEIAKFYNISPLTVKKHLENLYKKLGARNRIVAAIEIYKASQTKGATPDPGPANMEEKPCQTEPLPSESAGSDVVPVG